MRREAISLLMLLVALLLPLGAMAQGDNALAAAPHASPLTPHDQARYQRLVSELRCLVCQNQSIADSDAPLAADLRAQVGQQLVAGRSDAEIRDYLTARYGDFVLYRPPFKPSTWLLWIAPFAVLLLGVIVALRVLRARRAAPPPAPRDAAALQRLLDDEDAR